MNILIIHQGALGDFILSLPAIGAFRYAHPGSRIEIWGYPEILKLVEKRFYADAVGSIDQPEMVHLYNEFASPPRALRERFGQFDLVVIFGGKPHRAFADNIRALGVNTVLRIEPFPHEDGTVHVIDHQLAQLAQLNIQTSAAVPALFFTEEDFQFAREFFAVHAVAADDFTVALHIGSGSRKKAWPPSRFAKLAARLADEVHARLVLVTGQADMEVAQNFMREATCRNCIMIHNRPLTELAAVLRRCSVFVGNDSGITHLAAATGIPVVALFGPTDPRIWSPRGIDVVIINKQIECNPCGRDKMRQCAEQKCLEEITVEEVYEAVTKRC